VSGAETLLLQKQLANSACCWMRITTSQSARQAANGPDADWHKRC
jgi:hypothetical protein